MRRVSKPLLMPTLAAATIADPRGGTAPLRNVALRAQVAAWCGDVVLLGDEPADFAGGAIAFAVAHGNYIDGFLEHRGQRSRGSVRAVAGLWAVAAPGVIVGAGRQRRWLAPVVGVYSAAVAATLASATLVGSREVRVAATAGAALFLLSDSLLGARRFLLRSAPPAMEGAVMATYSAAQFLLAEAALRSGIGDV